jgi:Ca2+-binding RTX toxin-like protein
LISNGLSKADGGPGDDDIFGHVGGNTVMATGGRGSDLVASNRPSSSLSGGRGDDDLLLLGIAEGTLRGGSGRDVLLVRTTLPGSHTLDGGSGNDTIDVSGDGASDMVDCGSGDDVVYADPEDVIAADCERRLPGPPANARVDAALARFDDAFGDAG